MFESYFLSILPIALPAASTALRLRDSNDTGKDDDAARVIDAVEPAIVAGLATGGDEKAFDKGIDLAITGLQALKASRAAAKQPR